jgi:hypothetical protein
MGRRRFPRGAHDTLISESLAHATVTLVLETYSHVVPAMHCDAAAAMDAVLSA